VKLDLSRVTLIGASARDIPETLSAMDRCTAQATFGSRILFSPQKPLEVNAHWYRSPAFQHHRDLCLWSMTELPKSCPWLTDYVLSVHWDGFIVDAHSWDNEFFTYDFIGGPYIHPRGPRGSEPGDNLVINNGFYLSSKRFWRALANLNVQPTLEDCHPCDVLISTRYRKALEDRGVRFAPRRACERFAAAEKPWCGEFGAHGGHALSGAPIGPLQQGKLFDLVHRCVHPPAGQRKGHTAAGGLII
jgi:hypothetical protein